MTRTVPGRRRPALLVDVMDTLVHEPFFVEIPAFFGMSLDELLAAKDPTAWTDFEYGRIDEATFLRRFFRDRRPVDGDALRAHVRASYRWVSGAQGWVSDLARADHELHALSNYPTWWRMIEERLALSRYLEWSFVSCRTGARKPEAEAFLGAVRALGRAPGECLLLDDRPENVAAARDLGLDAILASDAASVRAALGERGLP